MRTEILLTLKEANAILTTLSELPIKYTATVMAVKTFFDQKFAALDDLLPSPLSQEELQPLDSAENGFIS